MDSAAVALFGELDNASQMAFVDGPVALWQGAQQRGGTGLQALQGTSALLLWEIPALPDFSSARFPDLVNLDISQRTVQIATDQARLIGVLASYGPFLGFSLRYYKEQGSQKLRLFLIVRVTGIDRQEAQKSASTIIQIVESNAPHGYLLQRCEPSDTVYRQVISPRNVSQYCELLKVEQWEQAWHDPELTGFRFWYGVQGFSVNTGNTMVTMCQALSRLSGDFLIDVTLVPTNPLTSTEREV